MDIQSLYQTIFQGYVKIEKSLESNAWQDLIPFKDGITEWRMNLNRTESNLYSMHVLCKTIFYSFFHNGRSQNPKLAKSELH